MFLEEPSVEFVELHLDEIAANTGAGYTICQKITGENVSCEGLISGSNITYEETCGNLTCDSDSKFEGDYYSF